MSMLINQIKETLAVIKKKTDKEYTVGIILGTGLGGLISEIEAEFDFNYSDLPYFVHPTVETHKGKLIFGKLNGKNVVVMQGRFHYYEGYSMKEITYPVRLMKKLGVKTLILSNVSGGLNPLFSRGDLMIINDHINLLGDNPLIGKNEDEFGPRFPDMSEPYSYGLISLAEKIALENQIKIFQGTYVAVPGPNLETKAEYRFLRTIGADVVGMSTIPEVIVANHMQMKVFGISIITDECFPDALKPVALEEILEAAAKAEPEMTKIIKELVGKM